MCYIFVVRMFVGRSEKTFKKKGAIFFESLPSKYRRYQNMHNIQLKDINLHLPD